MDVKLRVRFAPYAFGRMGQLTHALHHQPYHMDVCRSSHLTIDQYLCNKVLTQPPHRTQPMPVHTHSWYIVTSSISHDNEPIRVAGSVISRAGLFVDSIVGFFVDFAVGVFFAFRTLRFCCFDCSTGVIAFAVQLCSKWAIPMNEWINQVWCCGSLDLDKVDSNRKGKC